MIFTFICDFLPEEEMDAKYLGLNNCDDEICLIDSATTHTILKHKGYFSQLNMGETNIHTICGSAKMSEGSGRATIFLPEGTKVVINNALLSTKSRRNLLSFKDIRRNGYHIETMNETNKEYLLITNTISGKKCVLEKLPSLSSGLYYMKISATEIHHLED